MIIAPAATDVVAVAPPQAQLQRLLVLVVEVPHIAQTPHQISRLITAALSGLPVDGQSMAARGQAPKPHSTLRVVSWSSTWTWAAHTAV